jgi:hypothetical protein
MIELRAGKMPTTSVRRRISRLRRSLGLFDQIWRQTSSGNAVNARMSGREAPVKDDPRIPVRLACGETSRACVSPNASTR